MLLIFTSYDRRHLTTQDTYTIEGYTSFKHTSLCDYTPFKIHLIVRSRSHDGYLELRTPLVRSLKQQCNVYRAGRGYCSSEVPNR